MPSAAIAPEIQDLLEVRPKLRHDVVFLETNDGAYVRSAETAIRLRGKSAYRWLAALGPIMSGDHTLAEICGELGEAQQRTVTDLVASLLGKGLILDSRRRYASPDGAAGDVTATGLLDPRVQERFRAQIDFLDHLAAGAIPRFVAFRSAKLLLVGSGESLYAAAVGLLRNGAASLDIAPDQPEQRRLAGLRTEVSQLREGGTDVDLRVDPGLAPQAGYDLVLHCADQGGLQQVLALNRRCHAGGPTLVPLVVVGGLALIGPVVRAGTAPCWLCAQLRLSGTVAPQTAADAWRELAIGAALGSSGQITPNLARMLGNAVAFEAFRLLTGGLPADAEGAVVLQDLRTLESGREQLLPHPACPVCAGSVSRRTDLVADLSVEERLPRAEVLVGEHIGVFTGFTDDPLPQLPVKVARLQVPPNGGRATGPRDLTAFHLESVLPARLRAVQAAVREYAGRLGTHPGAVTASPAELRASGARPVPFDRLATWSAFSEVGDEDLLTWVPARELQGDGPGEWLVPLAAARPLAPANQDGSVEPTIAGVAAGFTDDDMIADGLASLLAHQALQNLARGIGGVLDIPAEYVAADEELDFFVRSIGRFGRQLGLLLELPDAGPGHAVVAVAVAEGELPCWAVGYSLAGREAVSRALCDVVGQLQLAQAGGAAPDLGTPLLPGYLPYGNPRRSQARSRLTDPGSTVDEVVRELRSAGHMPLLVETTTPDIGAGGLISGTVLLLRPAEGR